MNVESTMSVRRSQLFSDTKRMLLALEEDRWAVQTILEQLNYLTAVNEGRERGDRLVSINIGAVTAKMIEPADKKLLKMLYEVSETADQMAVELADDR